MIGVLPVARLVIGVLPVVLGVLPAVIVGLCVLGGRTRRARLRGGWTGDTFRGGRARGCVSVPDRPTQHPYRPTHHPCSIHGCGWLCVLGGRARRARLRGGWTGDAFWGRNPPGVCLLLQGFRPRNRRLVWWRCPTLPHPGECSTIGAGRLSFRVRNGTGRFPTAMTTTTNLSG